jgi:cell wall-associated NlpC family hydrolase
MLGTPYEYGGASPAGFDCSGLVSYAHERVGEPVPRTVARQLRAAERLPRSGLEPGDLVFFELDDKPAHVGIYIGGQAFIHAPSSGGVVNRARLDRRYWRERFIAGGRL